MASCDLTVSVETAAHDLMRHLVQTLADDHGLRVTRVSFAWAETIGGSGHVMSVDMETTTRGVSKGAE